MADGFIDQILKQVPGLIVGASAAFATISTDAFGYLNKDREMDISMVKISLSILKGENQEKSLNGRKFALRALAKYSGVEIPDDELAEWAKDGTIPDVDIDGIGMFFPGYGKFPTPPTTSVPLSVPRN